MKVGKFILYAKFELKIQDMWIGAFWKSTKAKTDKGETQVAIEIWICLIPCIPLHITIWNPISVIF